MHDAGALGSRSCGAVSSRVSRCRNTIHRRRRPEGSERFICVAWIERDIHDHAGAAGHHFGDLGCRSGMKRISTCDLRLRLRESLK
jgi:hypothetical protein